MEAHKAQGFVALAILLIVTPVVLCQGSSPDTSTTEGTTVTIKPFCSADGNHICFDCNTAPICINTPLGFHYIDKVNCAEQDAKTPYCTNGKCSANPTDTCRVTASTSNFLCTSNGYFPDPDDCQKFHFCVKGRPTVFSCTSNFVYSHEKNACIKRVATADCAVIKCKYTTPLEYVIYPKDPNVYGLCIRNHTTVMLKCAEGEQFDTKTSECIFVCKKEGLFAVPGEDQKYRDCVSIGGGKFELFIRECPVGSIFDADKGKCILLPRSPIAKRLK